MTWVEYGEIKDGKFIPGCGDRAVVILDGRRSIDNLIWDAKTYNGFRRPTYTAFQLFKGPRLTQARPLTCPIALSVLS
jgi:hypothetical protein